jgi:hypothetical protein
MTGKTDGRIMLAQLTIQLAKGLSIFNSMVIISCVVLRFSIFRMGAQCAQDTNVLKWYGLVGEKGVLGIKSVHHPRGMVVSQNEI